MGNKLIHISINLFFQPIIPMFTRNIRENFRVVGGRISMQLYLDCSVLSQL